MCYCQKDNIGMHDNNKGETSYNTMIENNKKSGRFHRGHEEESPKLILLEGNDGEICT